MSKSLLSEKLLYSLLSDFKVGDVEQQFFAGKLTEMRVTPAHCGWVYIYAFHNDVSDIAINIK